MITRYSYKWKKPEKKAEPIKKEYEYIKVIEPISFNEDKSVKEYKEREEYILHETLWADFINSFDIGSVSEQIINHLTKGTPLVTAHVLPDGDYTSQSLLKGAEVKREMDSKGITLDMIVEAVKKANNEASVNVDAVESEVSVNG